MDFFRMDKRFKNYKRCKLIIGFILPVIILGIAAIYANTVWGWSIFAAALLLIIMYVIISPAIGYLRWSYLIGNSRIEIKRGILRKNHSIIPISKIQHISVKSGPLMNVFSLATVLIYTAGGVYAIKGLTAQKSYEICDKLRDDILNRLSAIEKANISLQNGN